MNELLQTLLDWIALHPYAFNAAVFCISLMESLVVLGLLVPGAALLFGAGALIATGALPLYPILLWTIAGAITGDFISYLLGHHYHQQLRVIWPFRRYPDMVNNGVNFFYRHGGKSIFMARFIGPLRPIVPAIAGMMNMTPARFLLIDVFACILWAPVYILPGIVFGASLGLAAEVAGRLVVLLVVITASIWLGIWLTSSLYRLLRPHAINRLDRILDWSRNHPYIRPLAGSLLDPDHPEARGLATLAVLFFITVWVLLLISAEVTQGALLGGIDAYLFHALQQLRTPWADSAMVFISGLGSQHVLLPFVTGSIAWMLWRHRSKAAIHWLAAYLCAGLLTWILKVTTRIEQPIAILDGYAFPSAHTGMSIVAYGFLALLIARELPPARRWLPYLTAALIIIPIALSRLYLGAHWLSDVLAGLSLGIFWVALLGIAYDRHPAPVLPVRQVLLVAGILLLLAGGWNTRQQHAQDLALYAPRVQTTTITRTDWLQSDWVTLPAYRDDLEGRHHQPMNFQWSGSLHALQTALAKQGWRPAAAFDPVSAMNWLAPEPVLDDVPVLPEVHDGWHQALLMIAPRDPGATTITVVRLWPSDLRIADNSARIWTGKVASLFLENRLPLIRYLHSADDYVGPLEVLTASLQHSPDIKTRAMRRADTALDGNWQGQVLLAWE
ncbi:MAG: VTT domain-containing protein [Gammaproteobacteria bacterium]